MGAEMITWTERCEIFDGQPRCLGGVVVTCDRCQNAGCLLCDPAALAQLDVTAPPVELASLKKDLRERGTAIAWITLDRTLSWIPIDKVLIFTTPDAAGKMRLEAIRLSKE